jgi:MerR family transcriptional regulator, light-induced transcriptional regulator
MTEPDDDLRAAPSAWLTTGQAARALAVSTATVKRWAEEGLLASDRTHGHHRRIRASEVERLRARLAGEGGALDLWVKKLLEDPDRAVAAALHAEHARLGAWCRVADALGPVIHQLGREWEDGRLCVLDEHTASARLSRALARCCERLDPRPSAPRVVLATPEGEAHTLGLSLVELCLRERGWRAIWAGRETPVAELVTAVKAGRTDAVALSASVASDPAVLASELAVLSPVCRAAGVHLVVGGAGGWPEPLEHGHLERTFAGLVAWTEQVERAREGGGGAQRSGAIEPAATLGG